VVKAAIAFQNEDLMSGSRMAAVILTISSASPAPRKKEETKGVYAPSL
jgi:hypothetical protein